MFVSIIFFSFDRSILNCFLKYFFSNSSITFSWKLPHPRLHHIHNKKMNVFLVNNTTKKNNSNKISCIRHWKLFFIYFFVCYKTLDGKYLIYSFSQPILNENNIKKNLTLSKHKFEVWKEKKSNEEKETLSSVKNSTFQAEIAIKFFCSLITRKSSNNMSDI